MLLKQRCCCCLFPFPKLYIDGSLLASLRVVVKSATSAGRGRMDEEELRTNARWRRVARGSRRSGRARSGGNLPSQAPSAQSVEAATLFYPS